MLLKIVMTVNVIQGGCGFRGPMGPFLIFILQSIWRYNFTVYRAKRVGFQIPELREHGIIDVGENIPFECFPVLLG